MKTTQFVWREGDQWPLAINVSPGVQLVFVLGSHQSIRVADFIAALNAIYPSAFIAGCSTAGEIAETSVMDGTVVVTAIEFETTTIQTASVEVKDPEDSYAAGLALIQQLESQDLRHVFVLSEGLEINGTKLTAGLRANLQPSVAVTGGLAADGEKFESTVVISNGIPQVRTVTAIGFYGDNLRVSYGSLGGWDPFGPERVVTKSIDNTLFELDGKSALELYKLYLGEHSHGLPAAGLLFPLAIRVNGSTIPLVRTILSVDEEQQSITFAGDIPIGSIARLMKANFDRLVDGAEGAAETCRHTLGDIEPNLAILISCVGRKMVLRQRVEEEIEAVRDILGPTTCFAGFYSYGELSPFVHGSPCELHNQTMTITTLDEVPAHG